MDTDRITELMTGLGFSRYEALAYTALLPCEPLTGYELSGRSGIPRSKIYECIERLVRKNLLVPIGGTPSRYAPVPPHEVTSRLAAEFESAVTSLDTLLTQQHVAGPVDYIINISGYDDIIRKACAMIDDAAESLDISLWPDEMDGLADACADAARRGIPIRLLAFEGAGHPWGEVFHHRRLRPDEFQGRWIVIIKDRMEVLTGQCSGEPAAAWTQNRPLVFMSLKYLEHEIMNAAALSGAATNP